MCKFASFLHNPLNGDIVVFDLNSHSNTEEKFKLNKNLFREGHYLPNGEVELRLTRDDKVDPIEYKSAFMSRFPNFVSFFNWALKETKQDKEYKGSLYLRGLTSAKGLVLPKTIGGSLYLRGLTSAKGLVLPKTIGGWLYLSDKVRGELKAEETKC